MVKRKKIDPDPLDEEYEPYVPEEGGLTYNKRYTVGVIKSGQSYEGSKLYGIFFETEKLVEAKKEAEKAFKEDNLEVVVWDRDKWSSESGTESARYMPETEVKEDEDVVESRNGGKSKRREPKPKAKGSSLAKKSAKSFNGSDSGVVRRTKKKIPPSKRKKSKRGR